MLKKDWRKTLLKENASIKAAIQSLEKSALQIILVVNKRKKLVGTITDGDIRRSLLSGLNINSKIKSLINKEPCVVYKFLSKSIIDKLMLMNKIQQIPILDESKKILGLYVWDEIDFVKRKKNYFIIMAGGKGRRMLPYTKNYPKPLLTLVDKPILEHILLKAKSEGFNKFIFTTNYLKHKISNFFGDGSSWDVKIKYIEENSPLGTAGSLSLLKPKPKIPFIVCNGDVISEIRFEDLLNFHNRNGAIATMVVRPHDLRNPYGVVEVSENKIVSLKEKPISKSYVNTGMYVFDPLILKYFVKNEFLDMSTLFQKLIRNSQKLLAYPAYETWLDIGIPKDLKKAAKKIG